MEKTIEIGRFKVPQKGLTLADWFMYLMMDKFGAEDFFFHWDAAKSIKETIENAEGEVRTKLYQDLKVQQTFSGLWWEENVLKKERISEEEYTEWARGLYETMPKRLFNKTSKKEYQNAVSSLTFQYGPKFIGEDAKYESSKTEERLATAEGVPTGTSEG